MGLNVGTLPPFPWHALKPYEAQARAHPDGMVDLSVGTPVDPTPQSMRQALTNAANSPGYPAAVGTPELRAGIVRHYVRDRSVDTLEEPNVLPTTGSKEAVALLPSMLGLGPGDVVIHPLLAYPTYDVGARLAGATPLALPTTRQALDRLVADDAPAAKRVKLIWLNSPANPDGTVLSLDQLAGIIDWARPRGVVVASDECYANMAWGEPYAETGVPSALDRRVNGGDLTGILALYSLSKRSNAAGYRAAWVAGDGQLITQLTELRRHMGLLVPSPVQAATVAGLEDPTEAKAQVARYAQRRKLLAEAVRQAGYIITGSQAGLYLWVTTVDGQDAWQTVADLARLGILVAPGHFYGKAGASHVRMALTGTDADIARAVTRLAPA